MATLVMTIDSSDDEAKPKKQQKKQVISKEIREADIVMAEKDNEGKGAFELDSSDDENDRILKREDGGKGNLWNFNS